MNDLPHLTFHLNERPPSFLVSTTVCLNNDFRHTYLSLLVFSLNFENLIKFLQLDSIRDKVIGGQTEKHIQRPLSPSKRFDFFPLSLPNSIFLEESDQILSWFSIMMKKPYLPRHNNTGPQKLLDSWADGGNDKWDQSGLWSCPVPGVSLKFGYYMVYLLIKWLLHNWNINLTCWTFA